jgi:hypothetical protein
MSFPTYVSTFGQSEFDPIKFNANFEEQKREIKIKNNILDEESLKKYINNNNIKQKHFLDYTLYELIIEVKNAWLNFLDDFLLRNYTNILIKENRIYFIGITIFIIGIILYILR